MPQEAKASEDLVLPVGLTVIATLGSDFFFLQFYPAGTAFPVALRVLLLPAVLSLGVATIAAAARRQAGKQEMTRTTSLRTFVWSTGITSIGFMAFAWMLPWGAT